MLYHDVAVFLFLRARFSWWHVSVSFLLATAPGVNRVANVRDRWWLLPWDAVHVLFADVLEAKTRPPSFTPARGQFSVQKDLMNPHIGRQLLSVICRRGEATLDCPLQGAGLCGVLREIGDVPCSTSLHISPSMFSKKKVLPNTAWHWWRLRSYQNEDEHNIDLYRQSGYGFIIFPMIGYGLKLTVGLIPSINITVIYYFKTYNQCCGFRCYHL